MNKKKEAVSEALGVLVVLAGAVFLHNLYELSGESTLGVLFGSVNMSVWERAKGVSIPYFLYALVELMCIKPYFRRFVVSKVTGLTVMIVVYLITGSLFTDDGAVMVFAIFCGFLCSYLLYCSRLSINLFFAPACFLLMLIFVMTFSFTAFPPRLGLFRDPLTGCYGVLPQSFDMGAVALIS